jgi:hypothetical protein
MQFECVIHKSLLPSYQFSTRPTALLDAGGTAVGMVLPPEHDAEMIDSLRAGLAAISSTSRKMSGPMRGQFAVLEAGLQLGQGCVVSYGSVHTLITNEDRSTPPNVRNPH